MGAGRNHFPGGIQGGVPQKENALIQSCLTLVFLFNVELLYGSGGAFRSGRLWGMNSSGAGSAAPGTG